MSTPEPEVKTETPAPEANQESPAPRTRRRKSSRIQKVMAPTPTTSAPVDKSESLKRAEARTQELLDHNEDGDGVDKFAIDPSIIPEGWTYEWKRATVMGKPDPSYAIQLRRSGWEAVPAERHPEMMPFGWDSGAAIEREGMILMERPKQITDRARVRELNKARDQVRQKREQLSLAPGGHFDRDNKGSSLVNVKSHGFEPIPVPKHE